MYTNPSNDKSKMIGKRFGDLVILERKNKNIMVCICDCGNIIETWRTNLIQNKKKHCGCKKYIDRNLKGKRFGRLVVECKEKEESVERWLCICDCGGTTIATRSNLIKENGTVSCGCYQKEKVREVGCNNRFLTDEERKINIDRFRSDKRSIEWRKSIYSRDDYYCQICGCRGGKLAAHHKDSWAAFPERRYNKDNGVTLCWNVIFCFIKFMVKRRTQFNNGKNF